MKDIFYILVVSGMMLLFTYQTICDENKIRTLTKEVERKELTIDSLTLEIDTLNQKLEIFDFQFLQKEWNNLLDAIIRVESRNNDSAHAIGEDAVGCLQIRKTMVDDVNRILNRKGLWTVYTYEDRWDRVKSIEMFQIYTDHYNLVGAEEIARCWNGGPRGMNKEATVYYWEKVQKEIDS
jgi:hypothetical protein